MANPFSGLEDKELMLKYQAGDHMAFDILYNRHKDKVYSYLAKRLHKNDQVEDLYQKVFIKLHKTRKLYDSKFEVLPWIYTITKSEFLDFIKKKKIEFIPFDEEDHGQSEEKVELSFDLQSERSLSANEQKAIKLRYMKDSDFYEISEVLGTSESNVRKLISRGIKKLRKKYSGVSS